MEEPMSQTWTFCFQGKARVAAHSEAGAHQQATINLGKREGKNTYYQDVFPCSDEQAVLDPKRATS
jgi:hypothetical protein